MKTSGGFCGKSKCHKGTDPNTQEQGKRLTLQQESAEDVDHAAVNEEGSWDLLKRA